MRELTPATADEIARAANLNERFPRLHDIMAEDSTQLVASSLELHILPLVPNLRGWRDDGIRVLDVGCGRGVVLTRLAELYPNSAFVGMDLSGEATSFARQEARRRSISNVEFVQRDLNDCDSTADPDAFDFVMTLDAIHDQASH